jgi:hypothetical protein
VTRPRDGSPGQGADSAGAPRLCHCGKPVSEPGALECVTCTYRREKAQRRAETMGERLRRQAAAPACTCARPDVLDPEGRCSRCWGRPCGGDR